MAIDPITSFLLGSCIIGCWPCLLPCFLMLPIMPYPVVVVEESKCTSTGENRNLKTYNINGRYYNIYWAKNGVYLKKSNRNCP